MNLLKIKIEELKHRAARVALLTSTPSQSNREVLEKCRIIAINNKLKLVAIEAGSRHGVFRGMVFKTIPPAPTASIRVSQSLPGISSAVVIKGSIDHLSIGTCVTAIEHRRQQQ